MMSLLGKAASGQPQSPSTLKRLEGFRSNPRLT